MTEYLLVSSTRDFGEFTGYYYPPGGHVEEGEDETKALEREIEEETGIKITNTKKVAETDSDVKNQITHWYLCDTESYDLRIDKDEVKDAGYFTRQQMEKLNVWPATKKFFSDYIFKNGKQVIMTKIAKAVIKKKGKYLLLKRASDAVAYPSLWDFPGGRLDSNESSEEAVKRETEEETSLLIEPGEEIMHTTHEDDEYKLDISYFRPLKIASDIKIGPEHSEYHWLTKEEISKLDLHPAVAVFFESNSNS
jgi:8-oxo-dGTP diphosphatase